MNVSTILAAVAEHKNPGRRAVALAYYVQHYGARVREAGNGFHSEYSAIPDDVSGDYVSDFAAELNEYVSILAVLLVALDTARAELDAASFPAEVA